STTDTAHTKGSRTHARCLRCPQLSSTRARWPASTYEDTTASAASSTSTSTPPDLRGRGFRQEQRRQRPIPAALHLGGQFIQQSGHPVLLDLVQGGLVDARRAVITAHRDPRPPQDVPAEDLV